MRVIDLVDDRLRDGMYCSVCGDPLYPDCDVSSVSIQQEMMKHLVEKHPGEFRVE